MFKVDFSVGAKAQLQYFIDALTENILDRFSDTGIETVDVIVDRYIQSFDALYFSIRTELQVVLEQEIVLGRKQNLNQDGVYTVIIRVKNYLLIVDYYEDKDKKQRRVQSLHISYCL